MCLLTTTSATKRTAMVKLSANHMLFSQTVALKLLTGNNSNYKVEGKFGFVADGKYSGPARK